MFRGRKVLLDAELAALYGVTTKRLNEQVKRNAERFPEDFMFRLSRTETDALNRSQFATGSQKHRDPRFPPYVFTEHGAIMAATTLNSPRAVEMSVYVVRAFVRLRELLATNRAFVRKLDELYGSDKLYVSIAPRSTGTTLRPVSSSFRSLRFMAKWALAIPSAAPPTVSDSQCALCLRRS